VSAAKAAFDAEEKVLKEAVKVKAKLGWSNLKQVATTKIDDEEKGEEGVKQMLKTSTRATMVGAQTLSEQAAARRASSMTPAQQAALSANSATKQHSQLSANAIVARKLCVPNSSYFKAAAHCNVEENKFLDFAKVLSLTKDDAEAATVKAKTDFLSNTIKKLEIDGTRTPSVSTDDGQSTKKGRYDQQLAKLKVLRDGMQVDMQAGAATRLTELDEWQMYHINECFRLKNTQKSLPNLSGVGRCIFNLHEKTI
jgi:hypothetical protein